MILGRILTKSKKIETIDYVEVTDDFSKATDTSIPTLIIGKTNVESLFGKDKIHYLDKRISNNVSWTFAKTERRNEFEKDLDKFNKLIINTLIKSISYKFVNIFTTELSDIKKLIRKIDDKTLKVAYVTQNTLYIYNDLMVYGLSIRDLDYVGISKEHLLSRLKKNKNVKLLTNNFFLKKTIKLKTDYSKILVPYLYFLENY